MNEHLVAVFNTPAAMQAWINSAKEKGKYGVKVEAIIPYANEKFCACIVRWTRNPIDTMMRAMYKDGDHLEVSQPEPWTEPTIDAGE